MHFHMSLDVVAKNLYFKDSSVHHCYQRCVVVHNTHGVLIQSNVAYEVPFSSYFSHCFNYSTFRFHSQSTVELRILSI